MGGPGTGQDSGVDTAQGRRRVPTRVVAAGSGAWGLALLLYPDGVARVVCGGGRRPPARVVRLLGARTLGQQALVLVRPDREVVLAGAAVDLLHALSLAPAVLVWPRHARSAAVSGAVALASAALAVASAPRR